MCGATGDAPKSAFISRTVDRVGPWRALVWTLLGYAVAFACEYSSTRNGFPFGLYYYLDEATRDRELWVSNVPFMDSLSFVFLSFVSYATARRLLGALPDPRGRIVMTPSTLALGTALMVAIDLVCDPIALRGDQWFLGRLYTYEYPGAFFGIPLTNYLGWAFVGAAVLFAMGALERAGWLGGKPLYALPAPRLAAPLFYAGIVLFNVGVAFWIGLVPVGWLGLALVSAVTAGLVLVPAQPDAWLGSESTRGMA